MKRRNIIPLHFTDNFLISTTGQIGVQTSAPRQPFLTSSDIPPTCTLITLCCIRALLTHQSKLHPRCPPCMSFDTSLWNMQTANDRNCITKLIQTITIMTTRWKILFSEEGTVKPAEIETLATNSTWRRHEARIEAKRYQYELHRPQR